MGIDQGVEIGHHIPFNVVLPCDHAPGFAGLHRCHDARHVRRGHELRLVDAILRFQAMPGFDGRLMGKGAFRPKIGQLHMRHTHHRSVCPPGMPALFRFGSGDVLAGSSSTCAPTAPMLCPRRMPRGHRVLLARRHREP